MAFSVDHQLIADARRVANGANIHTAATLIAYYVNEAEIYNAKPNARTLDCLQQLEFGLRRFVNENTRR